MRALSLAEANRIIAGTFASARKRKAYALAYKANADVYAVQGYDAAQMLNAGLIAVKGDFSKREALQMAMQKTIVGSPRGKFAISTSRNPVQDFYIREAKGHYNVVTGVAVKQLADPGRGCKS